MPVQHPAHSWMSHRSPSASLQGKIGIEPALCETICEAWFRSWGAPGADGTWGGEHALPCNS